MRKLFLLVLLLSGNVFADSEYSSSNNRGHTIQGGVGFASFGENKVNRLSMYNLSLNFESFERGGLLSGAVAVSVGYGQNNGRELMMKLVINTHQQ